MCCDDESEILNQITRVMRERRLVCKDDNESVNQLGCEDNNESANQILKVKAR